MIFLCVFTDSQTLHIDLRFPKHLPHVAHALQRSFEVFDDFRADDIGRGEVVEVVQTFVLEPEDIKVELVALHEFADGEAVEAFAFLSLGAVVCVVAGYEVVKVGAGQGAFLEGEVLVGAQVVYPEVA